MRFKLSEHCLGGITFYYSRYIVIKILSCSLDDIVVVRTDQLTIGIGCYKINKFNMKFINMIPIIHDEFLVN